MAENIIQKIDEKVHNKRVYYQHDARFKITPMMDTNVLAQLKEYIQGEHKHCYFFWSYDETNHSIVVDESIEMADHDIFSQFVRITAWLFDRNYRLQGTFYCRTSNIIECILVESDSKIIKHYALVDYPENDLTVTGEQIIADAKTKMHQYLNTSASPKIIYDPITVNDENNLMMTSVLNRISKLETYTKSVSKFIRFVKICTCIGLCACGIVFAYMAYSPSYYPEILRTTSVNLVG